MRRFLNIWAASLLLFNGVSALYGGWNLIVHPDGSSIQLSLDWLKHTPFQDYLFPGIILFITNGLFSLFVLAALLFKRWNYSLLIIIQGAVLTGWVFIQVILIQTIDFLQIIFGGFGISLIMIGCMMRIYITMIAHGARTGIQK